MGVSPAFYASATYVCLSSVTHSPSALSPLPFFSPCVFLISSTRPVSFRFVPGFVDLLGFLTGGVSIRRCTRSSFFSIFVSSSRLLFMFVGLFITTPTAKRNVDSRSKNDGS